MTALDDGSRLEVGIVGDEGMLGASLMLGVETSPQHALVQGAGAALRMSASTFQRHYRQNAELRLRLNSYLHVLMRQLAQTAACTHYHVYSPALDSLPDGLVAEQQLHKPFMHANFLAALVRTLADASGPG